MATGLAPAFQGERRDRVSRPGPMTLAMRAARHESHGPKVLRVARLEKGKVVEERVLARRADVTIGSAHQNTFLVSGRAPESARLFEVVGDGWILHAKHASAGRVVLADGPRELGTNDRIRLDDDARGKVQVGDTTFLFQLVAPPPVQAKPQLPLGVQGGLTARIDWSFTVIAACSFLLHFAFAGAVNGDWFDAAIDEERETAQLVEAAKARPQVEVEQPKPAAADPNASKTPDPKVASNATPNANNGKRTSPGHGTHVGPATKPRGPSFNASQLGADLDDINMKAVGSVGDKGPAISIILKPGTSVVDDELDEIARKKNGVDTDGKLKVGGTVGDGFIVPGKPTLIPGIPSAPPVTVVKPPKDEPKVPDVDVVVPKVPAPDVKDVDSVIARNRWRFRACLTKELATGATSGGTVNVQVKVGEGGAVVSASPLSTTASPALTQCVANSFYSMKFSEPTGGTAQFKVPVVLSTK